MFASSFSPVSILRRAVSMAALLVGLTQCGDSEKGPVGLHDQRIESFAGGHVKLVWTQTAAAGECDTFATSNRLLLMGLDTRDGRGERKVLEKTANYSRPLLSPDGATILFTDKGVTRDGKVKSFDPVIYLTDWTGRAPERIQEGYACDIWRDPKTGRDWVYAVTGLEPTPQLALLGNRLVRFPLKDPSTVEVVLENTPVCPDNIQLSRSGRGMSAQAPWPKAGLFKIGKEGECRFLRRDSGCWTSLAPDDSELLWVLQGDHRHVNMIRRGSDERWLLDLALGPEIKGGEIYHPRWSNHARFIAMTGPYILPGADGESGSVVFNGGAHAQVVLGRLSEDARSVELWTTASLGAGGVSYPDLWILGGESAELSASARDPRGKDGGEAESRPFHSIQNFQKTTLK